jgi:hypothetical protein
MIGGLDTIFPVRSSADAIDFACRLISFVWPDAVFVLDNDPTIHDRLPIKSATEVIAYRDRAACDAWDKIGFDDSLRGTMVYLIAAPKQLTVTTETDPSEPIAAIVESIRYGLGHEPLCQ